LTGSERPASRPHGLFGRRDECEVLGGLLEQVRDGRSAVLAAAEAGPPDALLRGRCRGVMALARAHLVYGEWLRRGGWPAKARTQLRTAYQIFATTGAEAFAERTRREPAATGDTVPRPPVAVRGELTPQEGQIARRARDGYSNSEIGAELFISPRTVEWHLRKVFTKLGISSRRELQAALPDRAGLARPA
jgi:DNA-binding CsgD family transcriptional regulator